MSDVLKTIIEVTCGCCLLLSVVSCEEDIDAYTKTDPIAVVYGIINPKDSVCYIRLTKTFDCTGNTYDYIQSPTIQYFEQPTVEFELWSNDSKLVHRAVLSSMIVQKKEDGIFSREPNRVYGITKKDFTLPQGLDLEASYLVVKIKTTETSSLIYSKVPYECHL